MPNRQNLDGVVDVARRAARFRIASHDPRPLIIFPLASRIDGANEHLRTVWRSGGSVGDLMIEGYQQIFEHLFVEIYGLDECKLGGYFDATQLKHDADYSYGERIAARKGTTERLSLGYTFADFTRRLVTLSSPWEALPEEVELAESKRREEKASEGEKGARRSADLWKWTSTLLVAVMILVIVVSNTFFKSQKVLSAVRVASDPLEKALLLTALDDFPPPWRGSELARQVASSAIPTVVLRGHTGPILAIAFSPDGRMIATGSADGSARVWSPDGTGKPQIFPHGGPVTSVAWGPAGSSSVFLLTASADGNARVWGAGSKTMRRLRIGDSLLGAFYFNQAIVGVEPSGLSLETPTGQRALRPGFQISRYGVDPTGHFLATTSEEATKIWDLKTLTRSSSFPARLPADAVAMSPDGFLMIAAPDGLRLWNPLDRAPRSFQPFGSKVPGTPGGSKLEEGTVQAIAFSPLGQVVALGTSAGMTRVAFYSGFVGSINNTSRDLSGHEGAVRALAFSPDGKRLATAADDKTVRIWNLEQKPPADSLGWSGLLDYLRQQTTDCLPVEKRVTLLSESKSDAEEKYAACEKSHGRGAG